MRVMQRSNQSRIGHFPDPGTFSLDCLTPHRSDRVRRKGVVGMKRGMARGTVYVDKIRRFLTRDLRVETDETSGEGTPNRGI